MQMTTRSIWLLQFETIFNRRGDLKNRLIVYLIVAIGAGAGSFSRADIPTDHLIAYYPFDGNANDESGNAHHAIVYNATLTTDRFSVSEKAYYFDGNGDYIDLGDWEMGGEMSICFWVKFDNFSDNNYVMVFKFSNYSSPSTDWWRDAIYLNNQETTSQGNFGIFSGDNGDHSHSISATNLFSETEWVLVTLVVQGTTMKIYKNNSLATSGTDTHEPSSKVRVHQYLGMQNMSWDSWFKGKIDNLKIYSRALTDAEINALYNEPQDWSLPVTLTDFSALSVSGGVFLNWTTESETENLGFILEKRNRETGEWKQVASYLADKTLEGHGSTSEKHDYQFTDKAVQPGTTYLYRLADVDYSGKVTWHKEVEVKVEAVSGKMAENFYLGPVYPNPFNANTTIKYDLSQPAQVRITIYDVTGCKIRDLVDNHQEAGYHTVGWDARDENGSSVGTGIYFYIIQAEQFQKVHKMVLIK